MDLSNLIALLGGVALFLFGMTLMGDGLKKVAGNKLEYKGRTERKAVELSVDQLMEKLIHRDV